MADISEADLHVVGDGVALGVVAGVEQLHEPSDVLNRVEGLLRRLPARWAFRLRHSASKLWMLAESRSITSHRFR